MNMFKSVKTKTLKEDFDMLPADRRDPMDFKPSDECVDIKFYTTDELKNLNVVSQINTLVDFL